MSDIDTEAVNGLKVLDPNWPIREATVSDSGAACRDGPEPEMIGSLSLPLTVQAV